MQQPLNMHNPTSMPQSMRFLHQNTRSGGYYHSSDKQNVQSRQLKRHNPLINKLMKKDPQYESFIKLLDTMTNQLDQGKVNSAEATALALYSGGYGHLLCDPDSELWLSKIHKLLAKHAYARCVAKSMLKMLLENGFAQEVRQIIIAPATNSTVREQGFILLQAGGHDTVIRQALGHPYLPKSEKARIVAVLEEKTPGAIKRLGLGDFRG